MRCKKAFLFTGLTAILAALVISVFRAGSNFMLPLLIGVCGVILIFFTLFETRYVQTEKIVLIALLASLSSAGRILFASIPSVQPASFIIIMTGIVFGGEMGFMTGAVCALVSNLILGQGPWTVWQIFAWGMMGLLSGILSGILRKNRYICVAYGILWGFLFGWIMNLWAFTGGLEMTAASYIAYCITSIPHDAAHAIANAVLLFALGKQFLKILDRVAVKYGLTTIKTGIR